MALNNSYKRWHKPNMSENARTRQGYYAIRNKEKYVGDPGLVIYRSSWEFSFCKWCDYSPSILRWASEPFQVDYFDKVSKLEECKKHGLDPNNPANWQKKKYNVDFWIEIQKPDETIERWIVEVKPKSKLIKPTPVPPDSPLKDQKRFNRLAKEYMLNEAKFEAMKAWADRNGSKFYIFTEDQLKRLGIIGGRFDLQIDNKRNFNK